MRFSLILYYFLLTLCLPATAQIDSALLAAIKTCNLPALQDRLNDKIDINTEDHNGANALMWAVYYCNLPMVKYLVLKGGMVADSAVIWVPAGCYGNLQGIAAGKGKLEILKYLADTLHLPLDEEAFDPYSRKKNGWSPIFYAVGQGHIDIVKYLLEKKVPVDIADADNSSTPLIRAVENGDAAIFDLLIKTEANKKRFEKEAVSFSTVTAKLKQQYSGDKVKELTFQNELKFLEFAPEFRKAYFGESSVGYAIGLSKLAGIQDNIGEYEQAEHLYQRAIKLLKIVSGEQHCNYASSLNGLAFTYFNIGEYGKAQPLLEEALSITKRIAGETHPEYIASLRHLALIYVRLGMYDKARPLYDKILATLKKIHGEEPGAYTMTLNHFAFLYTSLGQYQQAIPLYREALAIIRERLGDNNGSYGGNLIDLGYTYYRLGQYKEALPLFVQAAPIIKEVFGEKHTYYAMAVNGLALIYERIGDYSKSELLYLKVSTILKKALGENHPQYAYSLNNLATFYKDRAPIMKH